MSLPTPGAPTVAVIGKGTTLGYCNQSSGGTFTTVAEMLDLKLPTHEASTLEVQRYDSPSLYPEMISSWNKGSKIEMKLTYNATQGAALFAMLGISGQFKVTKPDSTGWTYSGILTKFGDEAPLKEKMTNTVEFTISGAPVPTSASA